MKLRTVHPNELEWIEQARRHVQMAQELLRHARAKRAWAAVKRARKSVEGALRHAERAMDSAYYQERSAAEAVDHERLVMVRRPERPGLDKERKDFADAEGAQQPCK